MNRSHESGGVSLFVVIFTAILITIITVGFTRFVIGYQQQTQRNDLSARAYNSALAGVEDAKRVLVAYTKECATSPSTARCDQLRTALNSNECTTVSQAGITTGVVTDAAGNREKQVGDPNDNQAYTCVKIVLNTDDYTGSLEQNQPSVVQLKGTSSFNRVKITWFSQEDSGDTNNNVQLYALNPLELPPASEWQSASPPIMRVQYIPASVDTEDLDDEARTAFLYPSPGALASPLNLDDDARRASGARVLSPYPAGCDATYGAVGGACSRMLQLPSSTSNAYMQLASLYNGTSYRIELFNGSNPVQFDGVAPKVDSTGRAADLFRRVDARVEIGGVPLPPPIAALFVEGNLCKDFTLEDTFNPYNGGRCTP